MKVDIQPLITELESEIETIDKLYIERLGKLITENEEYGKAVGLVRATQQNDPILKELSTKARDKQPTLKYLQDKLLSQNTQNLGKDKRKKKR